MKISPNITVREVREFDLQRRVVAYMTSSSWRSVPHVTYLYEPDLTEFYAAFKALAAEHSGRDPSARRITFNTILIKAIVEGLIAAPTLNSLLEYHPETGLGRLLVCEDVNVALPWLLPDGRMITPIIAKANKMSLSALSDAVAALARRIDQTNIDELLLEAATAGTRDQLRNRPFGVFRQILAAATSQNRTPRLRGEARQRYYNLPADVRLTKDDLMDATVTISNIGSLYREQRGFFGLLEVIPPQALAIGVGAVQDKPGIYTDPRGVQQIGIRKVVPLCLAFDHRAFDFDAVVPFLCRMDQVFGRPDQIFSW
jgi:pyruvate dehydrogenase E2 component (dihydrolipoamide acetyltransferase)